MPVRPKRVFTLQNAPGVQHQQKRVRFASPLAVYTPILPSPEIDVDAMELDNEGDPHEDPDIPDSELDGGDYEEDPDADLLRVRGQGKPEQEDYLEYVERDEAPEREWDLEYIEQADDTAATAAHHQSLPGQDLSPDSRASSLEPTAETPPGRFLGSSSSDSESDLGDDTEDESDDEMESRELEAPPRRSLLAQYQDTLPSIDILTPAKGFTDESIPFETCPNKFGMFRVYPHGKPSYTPEEAYTLEHFAQGQTSIAQETAPARSSKQVDSSDSDESLDQDDDDTPPGLSDVFGSKSVGQFMSWYHKSSTLSIQRGNDLLKIIQSPDFKKEDFDKLTMEKALKKLDDYEPATNLNFLTRDKWETKSANLSVPCDGFTIPEEDAHIYTVSGIQVRNIMDVLKTTFSDPSGEFYHISGFHQYQATEDGEPSIHYGEIYTSEVFLQEQEQVTKIARDAGWEGEVVVAALVLGSDSTKMASFGKQSLWPMYLQCGNLSKYERTKESSLATQHIAYFPKLPDHFQDWYKETFGKDPTAETLSFMERELYHAVVTLLLNPELVHAYLHGCDLEFWDSVERRMFPRFFIHSMDYMERIIAACIKQLAACPCPLCLVPKSRVIQLGTKKDIAIHTQFRRQDNEETRDTVQEARRLIYEEGLSFTSTEVKALLGPQSLVPTESAFSKFSQQLGDEGFDFHDIIVPDFMHEFELGIGRASLQHALCIVYAEGGDKLSTLNERYRSIPAFGVIRSFPHNVSSATQWPARQWEDALKCAIPVFHQLLPAPHGTRMRKLLFELATWHALAKLRDHSEDTVIDLEASTYRLGKILREFTNTTCAVYDTRPLPKGRETGRKGARKKPLEEPESGPSPHKKKFGLENTFKIHGLGHHAAFIRWVGTSDNTSTQWVEFEHKSPKGLRLRVSKANKHMVPGIAKQQQRAKLLRRIEQGTHIHQQRKKRIQQANTKKGPIPSIFSEKLPATPPHVHHHMSMETRTKIHLFDLIHEHANDPALTDFILKLRTYILARILGLEYDDDGKQFTPEQLSLLTIEDDVIYPHLTLRVNFTTYDCRREQDYFKPSGGNANFMMLAKDDGRHRLWYGNMIMAFHVRYRYRGPEVRDTRPKDMDVVWVRWYGLKKGEKGIWRTRNLPMLGFINERVDKSPAFGFVDPAEIVRAVHLIPNFAGNKSANGLGTSIARHGSKENLDWNWFFINVFADRDMFMRYRGGGVGHMAVREVSNRFLLDRDEVDIRYHKERQEMQEEADGAAGDLRIDEDENEEDEPDNIHEAMRKKQAEEEDTDDNAEPNKADSEEDEDSADEEGYNDVDIEVGTW